jgi:DNA-binding beta-propeller fold protein YncE
VGRVKVIGDQVANTSSNTVSKIRVKDGLVLETFDSHGILPANVAFDGANIWVANSLSNTLSKF